LPQKVQIEESLPLVHNGADVENPFSTVSVNDGPSWQFPHPKILVPLCQGIAGVQAGGLNTGRE